ncbi:MAG: glycosyltransferase [Chitinophagaceae bacterium]|nr:glycosyltransferase [Chitinophagaceae bacterium]
MSYVLKLCGWYPSEADVFSGDFVQRHARSIATRYPVVVLFATKDPVPGNQGIRMVHHRGENLDEYIFYYPARRVFDPVWSQWYYLRIIRSFLPRLLASRGAPALVHVNIAWKAALWAAFIRKKYNWPVVVTENSTEYQPEAAHNIRRVSWLRQYFTRQLFEHARRFIPVSHQLAAVVRELYGPIPFTVVPNAVDTRLFHERRSPANPVRFRILHVSTLSYQKNPEGLLRVLGRILEEFPEAEVEIISPETPVLRQWVKDHEAYRHRVLLPGLIPYSSVAEHMQESQLLVLFSRYENLPCVILEAFCSGLPVVSSRVGGIGEVVHRENGILVEPDDEDAFYLGIVQAMRNYGQFNQGQIAQTAARLYNFDTIGQAFMQAYREAGITLPPPETNSPSV